MLRGMRTQLGQCSGVGLEYATRILLFSLGVICLLFFVLGCKEKDNIKNEPITTNAIDKRIESLSNAKPEVDANESIRKGDLRFIGIRGYTLQVPGVKDYYENYRNYGVKIIEETSDVVDERVEKLNKIAMDYAVKYNSVILNHISQRKMRGE